MIPRRAVPITLALLTLVSVAVLLVWIMRPPVAATNISPPAPVAHRPRLVVLSPALAVMLVDLGVESDIVGRHGYDMVLDRSIPSCGDQSGIDYESLLAARPTHVFVEWGSRPLPERLVELSRSHAWAVRPFTLLSLDDVRKSIATLSESLAGAGLDVSAKAASLSGELDRSMSPRPGLDRLGTVLMLMSVRPPAALGPGSVHHEILTRLGARSSLASGAPYVELDAEDVRHLAPGVLVLFVPRAPGSPPTAHDTPEARLALLGPLASLDLPVIRDARVIVIDDPLALLPTTRLASVARQLGDELQAMLH